MLWAEKYCGLFGRPDGWPDNLRIVPTGGSDEENSSPDYHDHEHSDIRGATATAATANGRNATTAATAASGRNAATTATADDFLQLKEKLEKSCLQESDFKKID
jgi:hypothetical protein